MSHPQCLDQFATKLSCANVSIVSFALRGSVKALLDPPCDHSCKRPALVQRCRPTTALQKHARGTLPLMGELHKTKRPVYLLTPDSQSKKVTMLMTDVSSCVTRCRGFGRSWRLRHQNFTFTDNTTSYAG